MSKPHGNKESWLAALRAEGAAFHTAIETAAAAGQLDASVPTCPDWTVRQLAFHLADVYRYVAFHVPRGEASKPERPAPEPTEGLDPLATFDSRYAEVVRVLESVDADLPAYNWAPQAKRAAFWHRRMAVETALHRWDAQVAAGPAEPVDAKLATDGINEVVDSMLPAGHRRGSDSQIDRHVPALLREKLVVVEPTARPRLLEPETRQLGHRAGIPRKHVGPVHVPVDAGDDARRRRP